MTKEVLFEFVEEWTEDVLPDGRLMLEVLTRLDPEHWARREPEGARQREGVGRDAQGPGLVKNRTQRTWRMRLKYPRIGGYRLPLGGSSSSILGDPTALFSDTAARFAPRPRFVRFGGHPPHPARQVVPCARWGAQGEHSYRVALLGGHPYPTPASSRSITRKVGFASAHSPFGFLCFSGYLWYLWS